MATEATSHCWLAGRRVLITGATSGIGRATALHLRRRGMAVLAHGRSEPRLQALLEDDPELELVCGDLATDAGCRAVERALAQRAPHALVLNAGAVGARKLASEFSDAEMAALMQVNLLAPMRLARSFARLPRLAEPRRLVLVLSTSCLHTRPGLSLYVAGKCGLMGFGRTLQQEADQLGLRTILVFPGRTDTGIRAGSHPEYTAPGSAARVIAQLLAQPADLVPYEFVFRPPVDTRE